jgi:hypothetical protein
VIDMATVSGSWVVYGLVILLLILVRVPVTQRLLVSLARRGGDWAKTHYARAEEDDPDEDAMWLMERRRQLCADLRRVEHLLATDMWMSATRQRGNRLAYNQLVDDLRRMPVAVSTIFQPQGFDPWDESAVEPSYWRLPSDGFRPQSPTVEVLEIGWGRRRSDARSR